MRKLIISLMLVASAGPSWAQTAQPPANRDARWLKRYLGPRSALERISNRLLFGWISVFALFFRRRLALELVSVLGPRFPP